MSEQENKSSFDLVSLAISLRELKQASFDLRNQVNSAQKTWYLASEQLLPIMQKSLKELKEGDSVLWCEEERVWRLTTIKSVGKGWISKKDVRQDTNNEPHFELLVEIACTQNILDLKNYTNESLKLKEVLILPLSIANNDLEVMKTLMEAMYGDSKPFLIRT